MYIKIALILGFLGQISNGVPFDLDADTSQLFAPRIVGGQEAPPGRAPHMAALLVGHVLKSLTCGGSIISRNHVLTAAHCIASYITWNGTLLDSLHIGVGTNSWADGTEVKIAGYRNHPEYDSWNIKNDIGILIVKEIKLIKGKVAVVALNFNFVDGGEKSYVTGWGTQTLWGAVPKLLQILYVEIINAKECVRILREVSEQLGFWPLPVSPALELCTLHSPGHGMCHGDSGSALISVKTGLQSGIVSWGLPCAVGGPDVFVRVSAFVEFIRQVLQIIL